MLSHVSTLAMIEPLIGLSTLTSANQNEPIDTKANPCAAYERVLEEVIRVAGLYLRFVSTALGVLINETFSQNLSLTTVSIPDAPEVGEQRSHFFVRPPCNLEEIKAGQAEARGGQGGRGSAPPSPVLSAVPKQGRGPARDLSLLS